MAYGDCKDIAKRTASDKVLKHFLMLKIQNILDIKDELLL